MVELLSVGGGEGCSSQWLDTLSTHSLIGQPWRHISNHTPWGAVAAASIFGTGDSICLGLCLCAAGNVRYCISFLIVFEFSWVMITILFILHCLNLVHMELSAHPPRVVTCGFFMARGLEREGRTAICQLGSNCSAAPFPSHLLVVIFKHWNYFYYNYQAKERLTVSKLCKGGQKRKKIRWFKGRCKVWIWRCFKEVRSPDFFIGWCWVKSLPCSEPLFSYIILT